MRFALVLALILGCGDNTSSWPQSGSRLKLRTYVYDDGTEQVDLAWFHDAKRGERCTATRWSDGATYCTPEHEPAVFIDERCAAGLGRVPTGAAPPPYFAREYFVFGVPLPSWLFRAGELTSRPIDVWELRDGVCEGPFTPTGNYEYYLLGQDIPSTELVRLKVNAPSRGESLGLMTAITDDGLHVPYSLYDFVLGECVPAAKPNLGATQCVPHATMVSYYRDAVCNQPVMAAHRGSFPTLGVLHDPSSNCTTHYNVSTEIKALSLYEIVGDRCAEVPAPGGEDLFVTGERVQLATFPRTHRHGARLEPIELTDFLIPDELLFDKVHETDCRRTELPTGEMRCVPVTDAMVLPFFGDAGCEQTIELALVPSGSCDSPVTFAWRGEQIVPLAGLYTSTIYELSTGDRCGVYVPPPRLVAHGIGPAIPVERFAKASLVIAP